MDPEVIKEIDSVLNECKNRGWVVWTKDTSKNRINAIRTATDKGWIEEKDKISHRLTSVGRSILDTGGVEVFLTKLKVTEDIDSTIKILTIKELKGNIFHLKYWWLFLIISAVIGFISGNFDLILRYID